MSRSVDPRERESIRSDLASADDEVRRLAVERLPMLAAEEALPALAARLGDPSWRVRKAAVECLVGAPEDWPVADHLIRALADGENPGRRNAAVEALVRSGRRMVEPLLAATASPDVDVRKLVVDGLAGIGSERAVPRVAELLRDPDPNVRSAAADALGAIGGREAARALQELALCESEASLVRFSALRSLARLEAPLRAEELRSALSDPVLRPVAYGVLGRVDDPGGEEELLKGLHSGSRAAREAAIEALLRALARRDPPEVERLAARIREAANAAPASVVDATTRLADAELGLRLILVQFLGIARAPVSVLPLLQAARDEALAEVAVATLAGFGAVAEAVVDAHWDVLDGEMRALAAELLGRTAGSAGGARLSSALQDTDPSVRTAAARGLARRAEPSALSALVRRLQGSAGDGEPEAEEERLALTDALVRIATAQRPGGGAAAMDLLSGSLEGAAEPVRLAIARAFAELADAAHAEAMGLLVQDPSAPVRRAAMAGLARIGEAGADWLRLALADEDASVRIAAAAGLGSSAGTRALPDLERLVADEDAAVRAAAVRAIGELERRAPRAKASAARREVQRLLERALADGGPVALAALEAYEALGDRLPLDAVRRALDHAEPEVVQSAVRCIRGAGREDDLAALLPLLSHPHWAVRADAIQALADRGVRSAVPAALRRLELEQDEFVRDVLLRALGRLEEA